HGAHSYGVVETEDAVRARFQGEHLFHCLFAACLAVGVRCLSTRDDVLLRHSNPTLTKSFAVSLGSAIANIGLRTANMGDPFAALRDQVFYGQFAGAKIVDADEIGGESAEATVNQHQGHAGFADPVQVLRILLTGSDDEAIQMVRQHVLDL